MTKEEALQVLYRRMAWARTEAEVAVVYLAIQNLRHQE